MAGKNVLRLYSTASSLAVKPFSEVPAPKKLPLLGHAKIISSERFQRDLVNVLNEHRAQLGDVFKLEVPGQPAIVIAFNPEDLSTIYKNNGKWPYQPAFESIGYYRSKRRDLYSETLGLLGSNGEEWYNIRSKVQQDMLRPKSAHYYIDSLQEIAEDAVTLLGKMVDEDGMLPDNTLSIIHRWALESIGRIFLDTRLGALDNVALTPGSYAHTMIENTNEFVHHMQSMLFSLPLFKIYPWAFKWFRQLDKAGETVFRASEKVIKQSIDDILKKKKDPHYETDLQSAGLLEKFVHKFGPDSPIALTMAMDGILAGIDTTGHAMVFLMYNLAKNPDKQEILYEEIVKNIGLDGSKVTEANLNGMSYLKASINESLRCMPVAFGTMRILEKNVVLSGYEIPAKTIFLNPIQGIETAAENFPEPKKFRPERYLRGHPERSSSHPFAALPFGHGARMCIGRRFATLEMYLLTIKLLQKYKIEWNLPEEMEVVTGFVNSPSRPANFTLKRRL